MRWTLGWNKIVDDWNELWPELVPFLGSRRGFGLFKDGVGHLGIGILSGLLPAIAGTPTQGTFIVAFVVGVAREVYQIVTDDTPKSNTLDRLKDILEVSLGGALIGLILG